MFWTVYNSCSLHDVKIILQKKKKKIENELRTILIKPKLCRYIISFYKPMIV